MPQFLQLLLKESLTNLALYRLRVTLVTGRHCDLVYVDSTGVGTSPQGGGVTLA